MQALPKNNLRFREKFLVQGFTNPPRCLHIIAIQNTRNATGHEMRIYTPKICLIIVTSLVTLVRRPLVSISKASRTDVTQPENNLKRAIPLYYTSEKSYVIKIALPFTDRATLKRETNKNLS